MVERAFLEEGSRLPETYFAPAERADTDTIQAQVMLLARNPVVDEILRSFAGILAVLNEERQILAFNSALTESLGFQNADEVLGLRVGEAIRCVHSSDPPGGCGTSRFCSTCGAAIATVVCQQGGLPAARDCVVTVLRGGVPTDLYLEVHASPAEIEGERFIILFLRDMSVPQQRAELERAFFHDISNQLMGLQGRVELLAAETENIDPNTIRQILAMINRLGREIQIQKTLTDAGLGTYDVHLQEVPVKDVLRELDDTLALHPAAHGKTIVFPRVDPEARLWTDLPLLVRVVGNMLTNALEATEEGGHVKLLVDVRDENVTFAVWSHRYIPDNIAQRVFQRHFSTKPGSGRGLGTYTMKLFGEDYLKGTVRFESSVFAGTTFRVTLPRFPRAEA